MIRGLLADEDSAGALRALLELIDTAAWGTDPAGGWTDEELPVLTGAPLCLVRAELEYRLRGGPAQDQAWSATGSGGTEGFDAVPFPVQLGCTELLDDGLVGYFVNDDYRRINTSYPARDHTYVGSARPTVSLDGSAAPVLTLLTSPLLAIHAISGLLPITRVEIPVRFTLPALERIEVTLRTGPVVTGPGDVVVPLPEVSRGTWSWLEHEDPHHVAAERPVAGADPVAGTPDAPPVIREGWLRLSPSAGTDAGSAFVYSVSPSTLATTTDAARPSVAGLQLTAYNGGDGPVDCMGLRFRLPIGAGAQDLTDDPGRLVLVPPAQGEWTVERDGPDRFTARPVAPPLRVDPGGTLVFGFQQVRVNALEGRAAVEIAEAAASSSVAVTKVQPPGTTELVYTVRPREIPVGGDADVLFRITAFNAGGTPVRCAQISVTAPVGGRPGDLVHEPDQLSAQIVEGTGWTIEPDGAGGFVLRPGAELAPGGRLVVALRAEEPVPHPGTAILSVLETAAEEAANRATVLPIRKTRQRSPMPRSNERKP
jgi:hypothetical protein